MDIVLSSCPQVIQELKAQTAADGLNPMGTICTNLYYCDAYLAAQHCDCDKSWSLCCQLEKDTPYDDEYNFAYSQWGVYIVTQPRTVWYVLWFFTICFPTDPLIKVV